LAFKLDGLTIKPSFILANRFFSLSFLFCIRFCVHLNLLIFKYVCRFFPSNCVNINTCVFLDHSYIHTHTNNKHSPISRSMTLSLSVCFCCSLFPVCDVNVHRTFSTTDEVSRLGSFLFFSVYASFFVQKSCTGMSYISLRVPIHRGVYTQSSSSSEKAKEECRCLDCSFSIICFIPQLLFTDLLLLL
jgi:hypothetical protein